MNSQSALPESAARKTLRIAVYTIVALGLVGGGLLYNHREAVRRLNAETAQESAIKLMERVCAEQCVKQNIRREDLSGPIPDRANGRDAKHKSYGFTWTHPKGELTIAIADAGWWIDTQYWWLDR